MELPAPVLGHGHGSSCLDVVTQVLYDDVDEHGVAFEDLDLLAAMARSQHELSHWPRFHGASVGHLLNLLRYTRNAMALKALRSVGPSAADGIAVKRRSGVPLWSIEEPFDPSVGGELFAISGQCWVDSYWLWNALFDMSPLQKLRSHANESAPYAVADVWLGSEGFAGSSGYPGNEEARQWLSGPFFASGTDHGLLTTRLLWECASSLDELLPAELEDWDSRLPIQALVLNGGWVAPHERLAHIKLSETAYGTPAKVAADAYGDLSILSLLLLIDFALNPPLPMLGESCGSVAWADFYPPERFRRCVPHGQLLTSFTRDWQDDLPELSTAYELLSRVTGLPYFSPGDMTLETVPAVRRALAGENTFHNSLASTSAKLLWLRGQSPERVLLPHSTRWPVSRIPGFENDPPPDLPIVMQMGPRYTVGTMPLGEDDVTSYLRSAVENHLVDEMVNGVGPMTLRLPTGHLLPDFLDDAIATVAATIEWPEENLRMCL